MSGDLFVSLAGQQTRGGLSFVCLWSLLERVERLGRLRHAPWTRSLLYILLLFGEKAAGFERLESVLKGLNVFCNLPELISQVPSTF
jgi:hypothetical protein